MGKGKGKQRRLIGNGKTSSPRRLVELSDGNGSGERGKVKGVGKGKGKPMLAKKTLIENGKTGSPLSVKG